MTFLTPITALLAAGITVPLLVLLYFLKLRRRQMVVSSTLLWKKSIQDLQVNAPFQKLRRNLLLLLQLILLACLLLAMARPMLRGAAVGGDRLVILLDHSASMNATDVSPTRLALAKENALSLIENFQGAGGIMVVSFAHQARVLQPFTTDKGLARAAVERVAPTDHFSHLAPALQLVEPYAATTAAGAGGSKALTVYILSDGHISDREKLAISGGDLRFVSIGNQTPGRPVDNLAITAMAARRDFAKPQKVQLFVSLANFGPEPIQTNLTLKLNGVTQKVTPLEVPAALPLPAPGALGASSSGATSGGPGAPGAPGVASVQFDLMLNDAAMAMVTHDHADDLAADNAAAVLLPPPQQLRVLLVSSGNAYVQRAIGSVGVRDLIVQTPKWYEDQDPARLRRGVAGPGEGYEVIVFDNYSPTTVPLVDSLYLGAAPPIENLTRVPATSAEDKTQHILDWRRDHPVLQYVAMDDVLVMDPGRLALPMGATVLATGQAGPIMAEVSSQGTRHLITSFNVLNSNWPMSVSFTVFIVNAVQHLALSSTGGAGVSFQVGDVAVVPVEGAVPQVSFQGPKVLEARVENGRATLPMFEQVGLYEAADKVLPPWNRLPVNLASQAESDLRPTEALSVISAGQSTVVKDRVISQDAWRWFLLAALGMLMIEWIVYTRRMHL